MISIEVDHAALRRTFEGLKEACPRAIARTLTTIAYAGQQALKGTLDEYFTLRNNWTIGGMRYEKATPQSLASAVGTAHEYLVDQVTGGTRTEKLATPKVGPGRPRPTQKSTVKGRLPRDYKAKRERRWNFVGPTKYGTMGLWQEYGTRKEPKLRLLYVFPDSIKVDKRWPMHEIAQRAASEKLQAAVLEAWNKYTRGIR